MGYTPRQIELHTAEGKSCIKELNKFFGCFDTHNFRSTLSDLSPTNTSACIWTQNLIGVCTLQTFIKKLTKECTSCDDLRIFNVDKTIINFFLQSSTEKSYFFISNRTGWKLPKTKQNKTRQNC